VRLFALALDAVPKLAPDPVAAPEANGVEKVETPAEGAGPNNEGVLLNEGVNEPKSGVWGEALDSPNMEVVGAEATGVENNEDEDVAADGVLKSEDPLPDEAATTVAEVWGADDAPGVAELANNPAT